MPDYNKGCIYMIKHNQDFNNENVYIGSCCNFARRKCLHKTRCINPNNKDHNLKIYKTIRENGGWNEWIMIKLHNFPCTEKYELNLEERKVIDKYKATLNIQLPTRSNKEYYDDNKEYFKKYYDDNKEKLNEKVKKYYYDKKEKLSEKKKKYYDDNKEKISEKNKKYRDDNKEKINEYFKKYRDDNKEKLSEKITCECGSIVTKNNITYHYKSKKHLSFLNNTKVN